MLFVYFQLCPSQASLRIIYDLLEWCLAALTSKSSIIQIYINYQTTKLLNYQIYEAAGFWYWSLVLFLKCSCLFTMEDLWQ